MGNPGDKFMTIVFFAEGLLAVFLFQNFNVGQ